MRLLWHFVRLPLFALLAILAPVVSYVLCGLASLLVLLAFFFEFLSPLPDFPFWEMLALGVACGLLMMGYGALMRALSR
jgi:hypothetical protein